MYRKIQIKCKTFFLYLYTVNHLTLALKISLLFFMLSELTLYTYTFQDFVILFLIYVDLTFCL